MEPVSFEITSSCFQLCRSFRQLSSVRQHPNQCFTKVVLLRWQEFAIRSVVVFFDMPGGEYRSVSRLGLLIGNRWMSHHSGCPGMCYLFMASDSRDALSEIIITISLSIVPRLSLLSCCLRVGKRTRGGGRAVWLT